MWADTLMAAEHAHLLRLLAWGAASVLAGTALLAWMRVSARRSTLIEQFGLQTLAWGVVELAVAGIAYRGIAPRDVSSATRLDRFLWLNLGLDAGFILVGIVLAVAGWRLARRPGVTGAGVGIVVQGVALSLLHLLFASVISR